MTGRTPFLHVANGTAVTSLLAAAGIPGRCSLWGDPLYEGPVPEGVGDEPLIEVRARFLAGAYGLGTATLENDLRGWRRAIAGAVDYDELVLWYEHDLFDQLNLIQLLPWIRGRLPAPTPVTLVCVDRFPGHPDFKGLGELSPDEIATLLDTRQPVRPDQYDLAAQAWSAFRASSPDRLERMANGETAAMPFLGRSLRRLLEEYPAAGDGLSRTERRLLSLAERSPIEARTTFPRMHRDEVYYITDTSFVRLLAELTGGPTPLLTSTAGPAPGGGMPTGTLSITDAGRAVLEGRADRVALCGIDRWIGGVHLQPGDRLWRWDRSSARLVPPRRVPP